MVLLILPTNMEAQRKMEKLGRGTVAIRKNTSSVFVSWRILGTEFSNGTTYNLYHDNALIASDLSVSNYTDNNSSGGTYSVAAVVDGVEQAKSPEIGIRSSQVFEVPINNLGDYYVHLAWVGDLDGDGEFEFVVDRIPNPDGVSSKVEAYEMDGTRLWQVDMGPLSLNRNGIEGGAAAISNGQNDGVTVYDLDGDGKAEVLLKTADGTVLGDGTVVEHSDNTDNFLSILDGMTGSEKARIQLPTDYKSDGPLQTQFSIGYLDGVMPSAIISCKNRIGSGSFNKVIAAYDYRDGNLTLRWKWLRGNKVGSTQRDFHQQRIVDVDGDGKDEIVDGAYTIDDNGVLLYALDGVIHGDRFQVGDFDPDRPGLEGYGIQQNNSTGLAWYYYDAKDGTVLQSQYLANIGDYARGNAADLDPGHTGFEMWTFTDGIYNVQDGRITTNITGSYPNLRLWWDGDVQSEMLDGVKFLDWNYNGDYEERILTASDWSAVSTWRNAPLLYGDIMGDWREEVVFEKSNHSALLIFNTTIPTNERIYTLAHNPEYRLCMTTKGYYQSAQLDYYLGYQMTTPPIPAMQPVKAVWTGNASQEWNQADNNWNINHTQSAYTANDSVLFGIEGSAQTEVVLNQVAEPAITYVISPVDYALSGTGELSGNGSLIKSGYSTFTLNINGTYTGMTSIEQGALIVNSNLESEVRVLGGATLGGNGTINGSCSFENRSVIAPGNEGEAGTLNFADDLNLPNGIVCKFDLTDDSTGLTKPGDKILTDSNLVISTSLKFMIKALDEEIKPGLYPLMSFGGSLIGDVSDITIEGLFGKKFDLKDTLNSISLIIEGTRNPAEIVWEGSALFWDLQNRENWLLDGSSDKFVDGDSVVFDETGVSGSSVVLEGNLPVGQLTVNGGVNYKMLGDGIIGGSGDVVVNEGSTLQFFGSGNTYTGKTIINGGTLFVKSFDVAGKPSSVGANPSANPEEFVVNNGVLNYRSTIDSYTDKGMLLSGSSDTIAVNLSSSTLSVAGNLKGSARLVKRGAGTLYLMDNTNSYSGGTVIEDGAIQLNDYGGSVDALGNGLVTFKGGSLIMGNARSYTECNLNFYVPEGYSGRLEGDIRCNYNGKLTGKGTLNVVLPGDIERTIFRGDWSQFQGTVSVGGVSPMRLSGSNSYSKMRFNLESGMTLFHSDGTSGADSKATNVYVGSITGASDSYLRDENWFIGGANDTVTFDGHITGRSLTKVGSGMLILPAANTYTGGTNINGGKLFVMNASGSATGTGTVNVNSGGILDGTGIIAGSVNVRNGGKLSPGWNYGTLTVNNTVIFDQGSTLMIELNPSGGSCDKIKTNNKLVKLGGTLQMKRLTAAEYSDGDSFKIFETSIVDGIFDNIEPSRPGPGLAWDTSLLNDEGIIRVVNATSIENAGFKLNIFPNPVSNILTIYSDRDIVFESVSITSLTGKQIMKMNAAGTTKIDMSALENGVYFIELSHKNHVYRYKICKE